MAWMEYICMLFGISVLFTSGYGNVIRLDKTINGIILSSDADAKDNSLYDDFTAMELKRYINLDDSSSVKLKDTKAYSIGHLHHHNKMTSIHHFARHGLCRNIEGKVRFYVALKTKLCHTSSKFIIQVVDDLCAEKGRQLDNWVAELFDLNDDGDIDHFEKIFYDD